MRGRCAAGTFSARYSCTSLLGGDRLAECGRNAGNSPDHIEQRVRARVGDLACVDRRIQDALPAQFHGHGQPAVHGDADVAFHLGVQSPPSASLTRSMIRLTCRSLSVSSMPRSTGPRCPCRRMPPTRHVGIARRSADTPARLHVTAGTKSGPAPAVCWLPRTAGRPRPSPPRRRTRACRGSSGTSARGTRPPVRLFRRSGPRRMGVRRKPWPPAPAARSADRLGTAVVWVQTRSPF